MSPHDIATAIAGITAQPKDVTSVHAYSAACAAIKTERTMIFHSLPSPLAYNHKSDKCHIKYVVPYLSPCISAGGDTEGVKKSNKPINFFQDKSSLISPLAFPQGETQRG